MKTPNNMDAFNAHLAKSLSANDELLKKLGVTIQSGDDFAKECEEIERAENPAAPTFLWVMNSQYSSKSH